MARGKAAAAPKPLSGGARMKASGKHPVLLGLTTDEREFLRRAAELDGRPLTQLFMFHTFAAARKIIAKNS